MGWARPKARQRKLGYGLGKLPAISAATFAVVAFSTQTLAQTGETASVDNPSNAGPVAAAALLVVMALLLGAILTSNRLKGSSLFNRLFIVVAVTSGFFSALSSAIGFSLITSQESYDLLRNAVLPPAFGVFVFFLAVAIWVGGAEFVRHRDWFRGLGRGFISDMLFFVERAIKMFVVIPILGVILFFVSTWTTVVGIGGVDAVRHTYNYEINRLQTECAGITSYRQKDFLFLADLQSSVSDVKRAAQSEAARGAQSGAAGPGAVSRYFDGLAAWYESLEASVATIITAKDPSGVNPYDPEICADHVEELRRLLGRNAFQNIDRWSRDFETEFDEFVGVLNRWRHDRRIVYFLEQQLASFDRANPKPSSGMSPSQSRAINQYAKDVEAALKSLIRKQKLVKPPIPIKSAAEVSPARGMQILSELFSPPEPKAEPERKSRRQDVVDAEFVPSLSTISPRDAVLKNANIFSDIWALAISWDYAAYILMFAFLFFPSAERAAGYKD